MKQLSSFCLAALLGAAALPAHAVESLFNYNYAQGSYVDMDGGFNGVELAASYDIQPKIAITGSYMITDRDNADYDLLTIGGAYHDVFAHLDKTDLSLHGELMSATLDTPGGSNDDTGLRFGATLRYLVQRNLETFGDVSYTTIYDNDLTLTPGIVLRLRPEMSAVVSYQISDNDIISLGLRLELP